MPAFALETGDCEKGEEMSVKKLINQKGVEEHVKMGMKRCE